jgi:ribulose-bisphosphate carboxylase large chain
MSDLFSYYYFRPRKDTKPEDAAIAIAEEETTGTWTDLKTRKDYVKNLDGSVEELHAEGDGYVAKIRYPAEIFEPGNIPQYLSVFAGNLFGLGRLDSVRLLDIDIPEKLACFDGPLFGMKGVRRLIGTDKSGRPHVGTIIKPKVGLTPKDTAEVAYNAAVGGVDFIKDDETLTDQAFCPMDERIEAVMAKIDRAEGETGRKILYAVNISDRADRIVERAERALEHGANTLMVDVITCGYSALQALSEEMKINVPVHVHRTMHGAMTRMPEHGIAMRPLARLVRLSGGDQLHTGTISGKMGHSPEELKRDNEILKEDYFGLKPVFPVASGGLHPGKVHAEISGLGCDIVLQAGGGIHGHPDGTESGARAMRQAVDAYMEGLTAQEYAKDHTELRKALEKWGDR